VVEEDLLLAPGIGTAGAAARAAPEEPRLVAGDIEELGFGQGDQFVEQVAEERVGVRMRGTELIRIAVLGQPQVGGMGEDALQVAQGRLDRKSTRLNSSHDV
jgi:hypothetical protein